MERVRGRDGMQRHDSRRTHEQFAGAIEESIPDRLGSDSTIEQFNHFPAGFGIRTLPQRFQHFGGGRWIAFSGMPGGGQFLRQFQVAFPGPIRRRIPFGGIFTLVVEQRVSQGAEHRLGMLPADVLQGAPTVRDVNRLVSDLPKITRAEAAKDFEDLPWLSRSWPSPRRKRRQPPRPNYSLRQ